MKNHTTSFESFNEWWGQELRVREAIKAVTHQEVKSHSSQSGEQGWDRDSDWGQPGALWLPGKSSVTRQAKGQMGSCACQPEPGSMRHVAGQRNGCSLTPARTQGKHLILKAATKWAGVRLRFSQPFLILLLPNSPIQGHPHAPCQHWGISHRTPGWDKEGALWSLTESLQFSPSQNQRQETLLYN